MSMLLYNRTTQVALEEKEQHCKHLESQVEHLKKVELTQVASYVDSMCDSSKLNSKLLKLRLKTTELD